MIEQIAEGTFTMVDGAVLATVPTGPSGPGALPSFSAAKSTTNSSKVAFWGPNNTFPQDVIRETEVGSFVGTVLDWKARALYGAGLAYGKVTGVKDNGEEIFVAENKNKEINDFLRRSNFERSYLFRAITDLYYFYNVFPELIVSRDRSKIVDINTKDASFCRHEVQNEKGISEHVYYNSNWSNGGTAENSVKIPSLDPYWDPAESLRERRDGYRFIYPLSYPTPGKSYYSLAHWNMIRTSGWLDAANAIAVYKKSLMKNQFTVKYLFETTPEYWTWKNKDYKDLTKEARDQLHKTELSNLSNYMKGEQNAGNSIMTITFFDPVTKQNIPGLKITAIDDKLKDGAYIEDSQEASSHLLYALGVDGTLIGNAPGKGMGAGSGSDKRVAFNNYISLCEMHRDIILEPLYVIKDYNGWDEEYEFRLKIPAIMTQDKGKETQQQSS
jgi:hypothetical protein